MVTLTNIELFPMAVVFVFGAIQMMRGKTGQGLFCLLTFAGLMYVALEVTDNNMLMVISMSAIGVLVFLARISSGVPAMRSMRQSGALLIVLICVAVFVGLQ